jgi:Mn2+/Fe2+ NRAMP family transporter
MFTIMLALGAICALIPNLPVIRWLVFVQVLNGALLPVMLFFILRLINDRRLVGSLKNSLLNNILGWGTFGLITTAVVVMLISQVLSYFNP